MYTIGNIEKELLATDQDLTAACRHGLSSFLGVWVEDVVSALFAAIANAMTADSPTMRLFLEAWAIDMELAHWDTDGGSGILIDDLRATVAKLSRLFEHRLGATPEAYFAPRNARAEAAADTAP